ncbi:hypothetical protein [Streptomyces flavofungini]|uniref:hypothetical protein n=1 Tax=Streptomyces flavofungini TaxID=68200 RepID=UPI0025B1EC2A|nr:hypothetical protein [Streptomyces flavofungini]WJV51651.1 hypothetical protein QUY26_40020 [Streptomyces flavofungini]
MRIIIEGASEEFERKLLKLLAAHHHELTVTADTEWTVERAEKYIRSLPAGARRFAELVVADGYADAEKLRRVIGKLNGPTVALSRAIPRGVRSGWWPQGTAAPIKVVYDPQKPSWQKAIGYEMSTKNVSVFRSALAHMAIPKAATEPSRPPSSKTVGAGRAATDPTARLVGLNVGSAPADGEQDGTEPLP